MLFREGLKYLIRPRALMFLGGASLTAYGIYSKPGFLSKPLESSMGIFQYFKNPTMMKSECAEAVAQGQEQQQKHIFSRSVQKQKVADKRTAKSEEQFKDFVLISGNSNKDLALKVANHLGTDLGKAKVSKFVDGECQIRMNENVRGKDVYVIQPTCPPVNDNLMELFLMVTTLRRASARKITAIIPYYGYARQDRKLNSRVPISAADIARLLETVGVDRVVAVDLHCGQIQHDQRSNPNLNQGFFGPRIPVDNMEAQVVGCHYLINNLGKEYTDNLAVVSPDAGGVHRAKRFQQHLLGNNIQTNLAMIIKLRSGPGQIDRMDLVGSVDGKTCIIIDDMSDTSGTLCAAAKELKKKGATKVIAFITHGLFSGPAIERIQKSELDKVMVTNTVPISDDKKIDKIVQLDVSLLLAETIRRIHQKESLSPLFASHQYANTQ